MPKHDQTTAGLEALTRLIEIAQKTPANHVESPIFYWLGITLPKMADGMSPICGVWTGVSPTICSRSCISFARNSDIPTTRVSRMKCSGSGNSAGLVDRAHTNVNKSVSVSDALSSAEEKWLPPLVEERT